MSTSPATELVDTRHGPARVHLHLPGEGAHGLMVLGTSFSGTVSAPDLRLATEVATARGWAVALAEQPYRVAGRRGRVPTREVDEAWADLTAYLRLDGVPLVTGGRSFGARIACRTAGTTAADAVLCLAFPLQPRGTAPSRQPELSALHVPALVVQGEDDPFGIPRGSATTEVVVVAGDHGLRRDHGTIRGVLGRWLDGLLA